MTPVAAAVAASPGTAPVTDAPVTDATTGAATGPNTEPGPAAVTPESMGGNPSADGHSGAETGTSPG